jgi:hypothetical protein
MAQVNRVAFAFQKSLKDLAKNPIIGEAPNHMKFCNGPYDFSFLFRENNLRKSFFLDFMFEKMSIVWTLNKAIRHYISIRMIVPNLTCLNGGTNGFYGKMEGMDIKHKE